jgi:hypothetical protein
MYETIKGTEPQQEITNFLVKTLGVLPLDKRSYWGTRIFGSKSLSKRIELAHYVCGTYGYPKEEPIPEEAPVDTTIVAKEDFKVLEEALEAPPKPNESLVDLMI